LEDFVKSCFEDLQRTKAPNRKDMNSQSRKAKGET
jgi:hypothetical protein